MHAFYIFAEMTTYIQIYTYIHAYTYMAHTQIGKRESED